MQKLWTTVLCMVALAWSSEKAAECASIRALTGSVVVKRLVATIELSSSAPMPYALNAGDHLETRSSGSARVELDDSSEIDLAANSEVAIPSSEELKAQNPSVISLLVGKLRALVRKRVMGDKPWHMVSGSVAMGVRGTEFIVEAGRDNTRVCTFSGLVDVEVEKNPETRTTVGPGQGVLVSSDGKISKPVTMDPALMDYWRQQTMVDVSSSPRTQIRLLSDIWHWSGPTKIEYLDPNSAFSQYEMLNLGGAVYGRALQSENVASLGMGRTSPDLSLTARAALNATVTPTRYYLGYFEAAAGIKSGHFNPEPTGVWLQQGFLLVRSQSSHSISVGRQEWTFGDGLIIGADPWSPLTRYNDGVLATLRFPALRLRGFASSLEDRNPNFNSQDWMAGAYADFSSIPLQLYGIWVKRGGTNDISTLGNPQAHYGMLGERVELVPANGPFFVNEEVVGEFGNIGTTNQRTQSLASALFYGDLGMTTNFGAMSALVKAVFLRASGDSSGGSGTYGAFIPLLNDTHRFLGLLNAFPQIRNIQRLGASAAGRYVVAGIPVRGQFDYSNFSRAQGADVTYPMVTPGDGNSLGNELDLQFGVEPTSKLFVQLGAGVLYQGTAYGQGQSPAYLAFTSTQFRF